MLAAYPYGSKTRLMPVTKLALKGSVLQSQGTIYKLLTIYTKESLNLYEEWKAKFKLKLLTADTSDVVADLDSHGSKSVGYSDLIEMIHKKKTYKLKI